MPDDKLASDEARRAVQHEQIKERVERDVGAEVTDRAVRNSGDRDRVGAVASRFRDKAIEEVVHTERQVTKARETARVSQYVDYVFFLIYGLLGMRLVLALMAANPAAGFVRAVHALTNPLYAPFRGITASPADSTGHTLAMPIVFAIVVYALLHAAIYGVFHIVARRKAAI